MYAFAPDLFTIYVLAPDKFNMHVLAPDIIEQNEIIIIMRTCNIAPHKCKVDTEALANYGHAQLHIERTLTWVLKTMRDYSMMQNHALVNKMCVGVCKLTQCVKVKQKCITVTSSFHCAHCILKNIMLAYNEEPNMYSRNRLKKLFTKISTSGCSLLIKRYY